MKPAKRFFSKKYVLLSFLLFLFWIILTSSHSLPSLAAGAVMSVLVAVFSGDIAFSAKEMPLYHMSRLRIFFLYVFFLIVEIFKANIAVARIVLQPSMPISPCIIRIPMMLKNDFAKVLYANSVTLTPGTLTVDVKEDSFVIHALTVECAESVSGCVIEAYSRALDMSASEAESGDRR
jgi:multicomponent Na+:H+ antiporter subunit E